MQPPAQAEDDLKNEISPEGAKRKLRLRFFGDRYFDFPADAP
jgi:hypothetical protein